MSAFIVSDETMHRVVATICRKGRYGRLISRFCGVDTDAPDAATEIGKRLFTLNIEAIQQRYPDTLDNPDNMPGTVGCAAYPVTYRFDRRYATKTSLVIGYKAIQCLLYQCSEGDVPKSDMFKAIEEAQHVIAEEIIGGMPEYEKAPWG